MRQRGAQVRRGGAGGGAAPLPEDGSLSSPWDDTRAQLFAFPVLMTEPAVASYNATNIRTRIERQGDHDVINGLMWSASAAGDPHCAVFIVMGKTDPDGPGTHR